MLGGGSNLLINDAGVPGLVIHLASPAFSKISVNGETVTAGGGAKLGHVISHAVRDGLGGLEALVGVPGTVAGAVHGNAGSRGGDIGQWTSCVTVMTQAGETVERGRNELVFAYRQSNLDDLVILEAKFSLDREDPEELARRMQKLWIM
jgi:UDP-N-acetylmuramate dehydrogenase